MESHNQEVYYSWTVVDNYTIIKKGDKSFFEYKGSSIPKKIKWFFDIESIHYGERKDITLIYLDKEYKGRIEVDPFERCRVYWHTDLGEEFKLHYNNTTHKYPQIRFHKLSSYKYLVEFLDDSIITEEKDNPFESVIAHKEGDKKSYYVTKYERNASNRKKAIEIHGIKCMICGFDFEQFYGDAGKNFIEVHHLKPLAKSNQEIKINPETDLVCVCANCHRIIHRSKDKIYSIEDVKKMISR